MPQKKSKKKKVNKRDRNEKVNVCQGCNTKLNNTNDFVYCVCTTVKFCSPTCMDDHPHGEACPGPPETTFDVTEKLISQYMHDADTRNLTANSRALQQKEYRETVQNPINAYIMSNINKDFTAWDWAKWADEGGELGNQACAYLAGTCFKHRILGTSTLSTDGRGGRGRGGHLITHNKGEHNIPILESQELAFTYYEKAAKLGHGLAMQSLGTCFDEGIGCRENKRRCNEWLWRACLSNSHGAIELLDSRARLPQEVNAQNEMMDQVLHQLQPGQSMSLGGPNLGTLLLVFVDTIKKENFSLRPFASPWATGSVNNPVTTIADGPRIPLIGTANLKQFIKKLDFMESSFREVQCSYGRRGSSKQATAMTHGAASRVCDNQLFYAPPFAACDERFTKEEYMHWLGMIRELPYSEVVFPFCVHVEQKGAQEARSAVCNDCEAEAAERLEAVAFGSVVLSVDEDIPHRGQAAVWKKPDGSLKMEGWKTYAAGEAETVLAIIAASGRIPYVHPMFIAQDPNFFWPLIYAHGSIRAALEFVAPHVNWDEKIGPVKENILEQRPIIPACQPQLYLRKCGNNFCKNMEHYKAKGFDSCGRCERRFYCSKECCGADWSIHKLECNKSSSEKNKQQADPRIDISEDAPTEDLKLKYEIQLNEGDDVVVHGLQAKPQYNGKVGVITQQAENGRLGVELRTGGEDITTLSIKPENLYSLGVYCRTRRKKSRVFECAHGLKVCSTCYFDFSTVNRLAQFKYAGQDFTSPGAIEQVNDTYFSMFELGAGDEETQLFPKDWPVECIGMEKYTKQRFILKALLDTKTQMTLHAHVAQTASVTFGATTNYPALRAMTQLDKVAPLL